ncbi:3-keto-5-aminohexanoate cleavage protein [Brenneria roseae subsp. roseae]|uniref:3-keto-5-aminohexanoate cleavage protein n=1 Tax=Brenneria roseae TaxID=1509241 RepID=UPI000D612301|nr:3-keto-5-aminohexanoate cleavage protein [Brenneria roseae]PWC17533.1 3-keto-5-aminohexanoate cleavage protein [Brenneria roseae subsp. roseae]
MRKIVISVAPVAGDTTSANPEDVAREAIESYHAGAAMVHLHVRERDGRLTRDPSQFQQTIQLIRQHTDMIIQGSTGGVSDMTIEERCSPLDCPLVEMSSLNAGSVNLGDLVYRNPMPEIKYVTQRCFQTGIVPEIEVFELGMIHNMQLIAQQMPLPQPVIYAMVLGHQGGCPATPSTLALFSQYIPRGALWSITHYGRRDDFSILAAALGLGACMVRVGFEDSQYLSRQEKVEHNAVLIERMSAIIKSIGFEVASPAEARQMFGLKPL